MAVVTGATKLDKGGDCGKENETSSSDHFTYYRPTFTFFSARTSTPTANNETVKDRKEESVRKLERFSVAVRSSRDVGKGSRRNERVTSYSHDYRASIGKFAEADV